MQTGEGGAAAVERLLYPQMCLVFPVGIRTYKLGINSPARELVKGAGEGGRGTQFLHLVEEPARGYTAEQPPCTWIQPEQPLQLDTAGAAPIQRSN